MNPNDLVWLLGVPLACVHISVLSVLRDVVRLPGRRLADLLAVSAIVLFATTWSLWRVDWWGLTWRPALALALVDVYRGAAQVQDHPEDAEPTPSFPAWFETAFSLILICTQYLVLFHLAIDVANGGGFARGWLVPVVYLYALNAGVEPKGGHLARIRNLLSGPRNVTVAATMGLR